MIGAESLRRSGRRVSLIAEPVRDRPVPPDLILRPERTGDAAAVEALYAAAFGPGRFVRTASRVRGDAPHDPAVSFVGERRGIVVGAIRQTPVTVGGSPAYFLGPLAVAEMAAKQGIGRALLTLSIDAARKSAADAIVLIGDEPFYGPSGFKLVPRGSMMLDGPVEPHRLLSLPLRGPVSGPLIASDWVWSGPHSS